MKPVAVAGSFDDLRSRQVRFLEEASKFGLLTVVLWSDDAIRAREGKPPKFPQEERLYFVQALRYVDRVVLASEAVEPDVVLANAGVRPAAWILDPSQGNPATQAYYADRGFGCHVLREEQLRGFPARELPHTADSNRKRVLVTGCYDWFHSGHVRFFEEVSTLGDLYVVVGHDANVRELKGEGHPLIPEDERRYMVQAIRFVTAALISSGSGWLDAEPEILRIKPDFYAVNEDGDKPVKREYCEKHGIVYRVFKRTPKPGLPRRQSTDLRGF